MQITGNYQIYLNNTLNKSYMYQNYNNDSQYQVRNNINCTVQNTSPDKYLAAQIAFTALQPEAKLKTAVENIFNRSIVFGPKEYKNLSKEELSVIREYKAIFEHADWQDISDMKYIAKLFSNGIHKKYPDGFTLVSIGRSPAFLAKYLELQGEDVKYCPISNLNSIRLRVTPDFIQAYKKYLDNIGLTADFVRATKKPIVFTDYIFWGSTLRNFERLLALPEIGINSEENMYFDSIAAIADFRSQLESEYKIEHAKQIYKRIFDIDPVKWKYSSVPTIDSRDYKAGCSAEEKFKKYYENGNRFEEDFNTKMMNFILADSIYNI